MAGGVRLASAEPSESNAQAAVSEDIATVVLFDIIMASVASAATGDGGSYHLDWPNLEAAA